MNQPLHELIAQSREREKTRRPLVIYHANCTDGFSAAWVYWKRFAGNCDFHPGVYSEPPPNVANREVFLVDFSYTRAVVEKMLESAESVTLIDHHKTALEDLKGLPRLGWMCSLDASGAMLAWRHCFGSETPPQLLLHVQDRDLWKFELAGTREIMAALFSFSYDFETWDRLMGFDHRALTFLASEGEAIMRQHDKNLREQLKLCMRFMTIGTVSVPVASMPTFMASDAGNIMAQDFSFAATYVDTLTHRVFSLRSTAAGLDVAAIAQEYGGGGHRNAAGFRVPRDHELAMQ